MNQSVKMANDAIFNYAEDCGFVDPISGQRARSEPQLSALLVYFHNSDNIKWDKVPL